MAEAVRVEGLRELDRALRSSDRESQKELRRGLREAGKIVATEARVRFMDTDAKSAMGMRPRVRSGLVVVAEQSRRRVTGQHPDYGAKQMKDALLPAAAAKEDEVYDHIEDLIDRMHKEEGF